MFCLAAFSRFSSCRGRLHVGSMAMIVAALPHRGGEQIVSLSSQSRGAFDALKSLANRLQEPEPVRAHPNRFIGSVSKRSDAVKQRRSELAAELCKEYCRLSPLRLPVSESCQRGKILTFLASECSPDDVSVVRAIDSFLNTPRGASKVSARLHSVTLSSLRRAATPLYEELLQYVLKQNAIHGMEFLLSLRGDLLQLLRWMKASANDDERLPLLKDLDSFLKQLFKSWFSPGMLELKRVTYENTSASIIEHIATKEAVHPVKNLDDLRSRLGPTRRVFALFHPLLPNKPLVFVHVALVEHDVPSSMKALAITPHQSPPKVATFYSISNSQPGLAGVRLGEHLLKESIKVMQQEFASLDTFVTLSPIPNFRKWLEEKIYHNLEHDRFYDVSILSEEDILLLDECGLLKDENPWQGLLKILQNMDFSSSDLDADQIGVVHSILMKLTARYILLEKHRGKPLDAVARFHISNGAIVHRVNFAADLSRKGIQNSFGMMMNYRYDLEEVNKNQKAFEADFHMPASDEVLNLLPF